jgi:hypothetical protein
LDKKKEYSLSGCLMEKKLDNDWTGLPVRMIKMQKKNIIPANVKFCSYVDAGIQYKCRFIAIKHQGFSTSNYLKV